MSKYTIITLNNEGKFISLHTEDKGYHISGAFQVNAAMLAAFLSNNDEAFYNFDLDFALHMYRISDSSVSVHLTWVNDMHLNTLQDYVNKKAKLLSQKSIREHINLMRQIFESAIEDQLIDRNPCSSTRLQIVGAKSTKVMAILSRNTMNWNDCWTMLPIQKNCFLLCHCTPGCVRESFLRCNGKILILKRT